MNDANANTDIEMEIQNCPDSKKQEDERCNETCKETCKDFMNNVSVHGLSYILNARTIVQRVLWLLLVLAALGYVIYLSYVSIRTYFDYPTMTKVVLAYDPKSTFPAVTICNLNPYNKEKLLNASDGRFLKAANLLHPPLTECSNVTDSDIPEFNNYHMEELVDTYGMELKDVLINCRWKRMPCTKANFSTVFSPSLGRCYTFNSGQDGHELLYTDTAGADHGLKLSLELRQDEYLRGSVVAGFKIMLHDQKILPNVNNLGFAVSPGTRTYVGIKRSIVINLPKPYRNPCSKAEMHLGDAYSRSGCLENCLAAYLGEKCGCIYNGMENENGPNEICDLKRTIQCLKPYKDRFSQEVGKICTCPDPCKYVDYTPSLSYAQAPSLSAVDDIKQDDFEDIGPGNGSNDQSIINGYRSIWVDVDIFYQDLYYQMIEQVPAFSLEQLLGALGGQIGLFLGASLLSLYEFFDLILNLLLNLSQKSYIIVKPKP